MFFIGLFLIFIFIILHLRYRKSLNAYPVPKSYPTISILVPAYNEEKNIGETIRCLLALKYPKGRKEIIVINDGSRDRTAEVVRKFTEKHKEITLIDKPNSGKANSLNYALKRTRGDLIAVVDADSYPNQDALEKMVGHFEDEKVAAVTSRVLVKNKERMLGKFQVMDYSIIAWTRKLLDFVDSVYVTNGPLSIYRSSVIKRLGGFDPTNLTEDIEITWHVLSEGYKTRMSYSAIVYTSVPLDLKTWIKQRVRWNLGGIQTVRKYYKSMFSNAGNMFGYFVVPYVSASFILAIVGILLFIRYVWVKGTYQLLSAYYALQGYDYFRYFEFSFSFTLLIFFGALFFICSIFHYKMGFRNSETGDKSVLKILAYSVLYRALYIIPLVAALYKLAKGDLRWYTK